MIYFKSFLDAKGRQTLIRGFNQYVYETVKPATTMSDSLLNKNEKPTSFFLFYGSSNSESKGRMDQECTGSTPNRVT